MQSYISLLYLQINKETNTAAVMNSDSRSDSTRNN